MAASLSRHPVLAPVVLASALLLAFALGTVPTDIQQPGTQSGEVTNIQNVNKCDNCHGGYDAAVEPAANWRGSMMAQATRDPIFYATVAIAEQDFPGAGDLCIRCHTPDGWLGGRSVPTDGSGLSSSGDADGVSCDFCHRLTNPDGSEHPGVQSAPFLAYDGDDGYHGSGMYVMSPDSNLKLGPYSNAQPNHSFAKSNYHRSSALCGTCHDVSNPAVGDLAHNNGSMTPLEPGTFSGVPGAPVEQRAAFNNEPYAYGVIERTFSEHEISALSSLPVSQFPNLPADLQQGSLLVAYNAAMASTADGNYVDGDVRTFTCQTCHMPPVQGYGCDKAGVPFRDDLPLHDMTGGNYWMPDVLLYLDGLGKLVLGGGLNALEIDSLGLGKTRALTNLENAAALEVTDDTLKVINLTGHKLISGYPEGRRMWLNMKWYDDQGTLLREDGEYGQLSVTLDGQPTTVETILDLDGTNTRIYEAHFGMTQEWANQLLSLGYDPLMPLVWDRVTGAVTTTLGDVGAQAPGTYAETFHFVLNNKITLDNRIPPYGFDYDEALEHNALPVPDTQFGDPGPAGVFDYWDEVALAPPPGAVSGTIDLLYQPTSWEYIHFLYVANDGSEAYLADTGADLLDAWFNTGMAAPHTMASTTWTGSVPADPWTDLGFALAGTHGLPSLDGTGTLVGGTPLSLDLTNAVASSTATLFAGLSKLYAPFKGGTLVPSFEIMILGLPTGTGSVSLGGTWPTGLPTGVSITFQFWIVDAAGPAGFSASNAVQGITP
ncbi:MAG: hypothetical protein ACYTG2_00740 [Planctomycetota bacterium]|jgi:hypothetical protein